MKRNIPPQVVGIPMIPPPMTRKTGPPPVEIDQGVVNGVHPVIAIDMMSIITIIIIDQKKRWMKTREESQSGGGKSRQQGLTIVITTGPMREVG